MPVPDLRDEDDLEDAATVEAGPIVRNARLELTNIVEEEEKEKVVASD